MLDQPPLCPTAASVRAAPDSLAQRLAKQGATVSRHRPALPNLARTTRNDVELLARGWPGGHGASSRG